MIHFHALVINNNPQPWRKGCGQMGQQSPPTFTEYLLGLPTDPNILITCTHRLRGKLKDTVQFKTQLPFLEIFLQVKRRNIFIQNTNNNSKGQHHPITALKWNLYYNAVKQSNVCKKDRIWNCGSNHQTEVWLEKHRALANELFATLKEKWPQVWAKTQESYQKDAKLLFR